MSRGALLHRRMRVGTGMKRGGMTAVAAVTAAVAVLGVAGTASAAEGYRAHWALDEPGTPASAFDTAGTNHGTNHSIVGTGSGYVFNGTSSRVIVPDSTSLNPGTANFSYGATIVMDAPPGARSTDDILRKGVDNGAGGYYKLEVVDVQGVAKARCRVKDANGVVAAIQAPTSLADGLPHTLTCNKTGTSVSVKVDGYRPRIKTVASLGSISNAYDLALGAKAEATATTGFDWFTGTMLDAWIR